MNLKRSVALSALVCLAFQVATPLSSTTVFNKKPLRLRRVSFGAILPHSTFRTRNYRSAIVSTLQSYQKVKPPLLFTSKYEIAYNIVQISRRPSPTAILKNLCSEFIAHNVTAILFLTNYETYGRETASSQYCLQLAGYLGIPVIAWNADNSGLERRASQSSLQLQLAPSLEHQTAAMLSILERYKWHQFSVVTSPIAGHDDFIQAVREKALQMYTRFKLTILDTVIVGEEVSLSQLVNSEARIILLYSTKEEAREIFKQAERHKLTGSKYLWIVTQSVIGSAVEAPDEFPVGMIGVHFPTNDDHLTSEISRAVRVYVHGLELLLADPDQDVDLTPRLACDGRGDARWRQGELFYRYLRNVSIEEEQGRPNMEFNQDGRVKSSELVIVNLRPNHIVSSHNVWEQIGVWKSWQKEGLDIKDIVWPGNTHTPPQGVPEKFHLKITFLEEPPYINLAPPDPVTGKCTLNKGVFCQMGRDTDLQNFDSDLLFINRSSHQCCSGFCIDLLEKFAEDLGFTYELFRVKDGKWGAQTNGKWNGLVAALINHHADMVMTSLKINFDRSQAIDFSLPFLDTGIAIVVAKRTGIISPTAFLEPFDSAMWMLVALGAIHVAAVSIFFFEWLSPYGYDGKMVAPREHRFSLCRTLWLVWAILFQAAVNVDCPRGYTARCMANIWAMFALIFLAIYTANLAAFMITREEFHDLSGINDTKLNNPYSLKPSFRFGTIPHGNTDAVLMRNFPSMHGYMRQFNRSTVIRGVQAVKDGKLDAFIYDATVLDYLVGQDSECVLLTVGSWFAMTGYGVGFPRHSKYKNMINKQLMEYRENGDLERLQRYWFSGVCNKPGNKEKQSRSDPLALEQFISTFLLLGCGILIAAVLLGLEMSYWNWVGRQEEEGTGDRRQCFSLLSRSVGQLTREQNPETRPCSGRCATLLSSLEEVLQETNERICQLEAELQLHTPSEPQPPRDARPQCKDLELYYIREATCQVHGRRFTRSKKSNRFLWSSWQTHTVHSNSTGALEEYYSSSPSTPRSFQDYTIEYSNVWSSPIHIPMRRSKRVDERETVL